MQRWLVSILAFLALLAWTAVARAQEDEPRPPLAILAPTVGEVLQGVVDVHLAVGELDITSAELQFGYTNDTTGTWFLIWEGVGALPDGLLTAWNTTTLTDGNYTLRLVANLADGGQMITEVPDLRLRNYSPVETSTPSPTLTPGLQDTPTPTPTALPSQTPFPGTPTPLPPNPASLTPSDLAQGLLYGGLGVLGFFLVIGLYSFLRRAFRYRG